jgi:SpoVK/Ycf46/Vps4 family AAA+-type ATPase
MDGVDTVSTETSKILICGTTNRLGSIDAALLRPGRFEEHIFIDLPKMNDILDMMSIFLEKVPLSPSLDLSEIAELLEELGASAADVRGLCSDACMHAIENINVIADNTENIHLDSEDFDDVIRRWKD